MKKRCTAVLLAAGSGSRMKSDIAKQYMPLGEAADLVCTACD